MLSVFERVMSPGNFIWQRCDFPYSSFRRFSGLFTEKRRKDIRLKKRSFICQSTACEVMRVTMNDRWTEHSLAMPADNIHIRHIRNLAGRGRSSTSGGGRMSTGDRSHEHHG